MRTLISVALLSGLAAGVFYFNEARKEVKFLCANFGAGVSDSSVLSQLNTGDFLRFSMVGSEQGTRLVVDSLYTLTLHRCVIELDARGRVITAYAGFALPF